MVQLISMKILLSSQTRISSVRINDTYHVRVELENENYIHGHLFESLIDATDLAAKILEVRQLDLQHWRAAAAESDIWDRFLIRDRDEEGKEYKAHLWSGLDTFCKMWSTGGMGYNYNLFNTNLDRDICIMCCNKLKKKSKKI